MAARGTGTPIGLASATRLLPNTSRERWRRDRTFALLHDLNGMYFTMQGNDAGTSATQRRDDARERVARRLAGLRWIAENVLADTWRFIREELDGPEDAFGPAMVLVTLAREDADVRRWLATLPPEIAKAVSALERAVPSL